VSAVRVFGHDLEARAGGAVCRNSSSQTAALGRMPQIWIERVRAARSVLTPRRRVCAEDALGRLPHVPMEEHKTIPAGSIHDISRRTWGKINFLRPLLFGSERARSIHIRRHRDAGELHLCVGDVKVAPTAIAAEARDVALHARRVGRKRCFEYGPRHFFSSVIPVLGGRKSSQELVDSGLRRGGGRQVRRVRTRMPDTHPTIIETPFFWPKKCVVLPEQKWQETMLMQET
jgi:hypothetical protein